MLRALSIRRIVIVDARGTIRYKFIGPLSPQTYEGAFLPELEKVLATPQG